LTSVAVELQILNLQNEIIKLRQENDQMRSQQQKLPLEILPVSNINNDPGPNTDVPDVPAGSDNGLAIKPIVTQNGIAKPHGQNYINMSQILNISDDEYNGYLVNIFNVY